jgi:hypothetical protein
MLKTIKKSANKKLGPCASTYRSGTGSVYGTCPNTCELKPPGNNGAAVVDQEYLKAVIEAVPEGGLAWTYTHFWPGEVPKSKPGETCINISTDTIDMAVETFQMGYPGVVVVPSTQDAKVDRVGDIRMVRCPAEYSNITCFTCGGGVPLCARQDRDFIVKFTAHGNQAKKIMMRVESGGRVIDAERGGCYGNSGPVRLQWEKSKGNTMNDAEILKSFVAGLEPGTLLRHHVVGDLGKETSYGN